MTTTAFSPQDDFWGSNPTVVELRAANRWDAIDELIDCLAATHKIEPGLKGCIVAAVKERETACSTGIGEGIALPHASTDLVSEIVCAVGFSKKGMQFNALDSKPVDLVLLFLVPHGQFQKHLKTLANIAKLSLNPDFRDGIKRRFML